MSEDKWVEVEELCESVEAKCRVWVGTFCREVLPESKPELLFSSISLSVSI